MGEYLIPSDRYSEAGICNYTWRNPEEAKAIFERVPPAVFFHEPCKAFAMVVPKLLNQGRTMSYRNICAEILNHGFKPYTAEAIWTLMLSFDAIHCAMDIERCVNSVLEAYMDRDRGNALQKLWGLTEDPTQYKAQLQTMLRMEDVIAPMGPLPCIESVTALNAIELEPATSLLGDGLLNKRGLMWIHAASGVGKTFLALQLAGAMATGQDWLGFTVPKISRVLYLQGEVDRSWWKERSLALAREMGVRKAGLESLYFCHDRWAMARWTYKGDVLCTQGLKTLGLMAQRLGAEVVFVDPFAKYTAVPENSTDANRELVNALDEFRQKYALTLVLCHHDRKPQPGSPPEMRGSNVLEAEADSSIQLSYTKEHTRLVWKKVRHTMAPPHMILARTKNGFFEVFEEPEEPAE